MEQRSDFFGIGPPYLIVAHYIELEGWSTRTSTEPLLQEIYGIRNSSPGKLIDRIDTLACLDT